LKKFISSSKSEATEETCERAWVKIKGAVAIIRTENNAYALVPIDELCKLAKRFNLCYENYECKE